MTTALDRPGQTLTSSASCTIEVVFSPISIGAESVNLSIPSNDPITPILNVALRGKGAVITMISPNGGEAIPTGSSYTIRWGAASESKKFKLMLSINNGSSWIKIHSEPFITGTSYDWLVPVLTRNEENCLAKIIGYDASGVKVKADSSDAPFTIEVLKVTYPDGEEVFTSVKLQSEVAENKSE